MGVDIHSERFLQRFRQLFKIFFKNFKILLDFCTEFWYSTLNLHQSKTCACIFKHVFSPTGEKGGPEEVKHTKLTISVFPLTGKSTQRTANTKTLERLSQYNFFQAGKNQDGAELCNSAK